ncbi:MAG: carboxypeptidase-like regulatory domain-containing protein [Acidobacteriia bacterium]|nr:carboxypeptidase-like regulatory domain-containing protein [Terriglobia bacterium]
MHTLIAIPLTSFFAATAIWGAQIGGVVLDKKSGQGIAGVVVRATPQTPKGRNYETRTDRQGAFILKVERGQYQLRAIPAGTNYLPGFFRRSEADTSPSTISLVAEDVFSFADISLELGGSIEGQISRAADGEALNNVRVSALGGSHRASAVTDSRGHYVLRALPRDAYVVVAGVLDSDYIPVYYPKVYNAGEAEPLEIHPGDRVSGINMKLNFGARIQGRVFSATTNKPLSGVMAIAVPLEGTNPERFAYSDPEGFYSINGLIPGNYRIEAGDEENDTKEGTKVHQFITQYFDLETDRELAKTVPVSVAETITGVDFKLYRGNRIEGRIRSVFYNRPLAGVLVRPVLIKPSKVPIPTATSGPDGRYVVEDLPPGTYAVTATPPEASEHYFPLWYRDSVSRSKATTLTLLDGDVYPNVDFDFHLGGDVSGRVATNDPDYPLDPEQCRVILSGVGNEIDGFVPERFELDSDGRYSIVGAPPGRYHLHVESDDPNLIITAMDTKTIVVNEGREQRNVDFLLRVGGSITGLVTLKHSHLTIEEYRILLLRVNESFHAFYKIDKDHYTIAGIAPGKYIVALVEAQEPLTLEKLFSGPRHYQSLIVDVKKGLTAKGVDFVIDESHPPAIAPF